MIREAMDFVDAFDPEVGRHQKSLTGREEISSLSRLRTL